MRSVGEAASDRELRRDGGDQEDSDGRAGAQGLAARSESNGSDVSGLLDHAAAESDADSPLTTRHRLPDALARWMLWFLGEVTPCASRFRFPC
jgi:hypothetical protein